MVIDSLDNLTMYVSLHPRFPKAFNCLKKLDFSQLSKGKIIVDENMYVNVDEVSLRPVEGARYETHDKYIDIQIPLTANEKVGYIDRSLLGAPSEVNETKDYALYDAPMATTLDLRVGSFAIFFPQDGHMPIIGEGMTKKIVMKIRV